MSAAPFSASSTPTRARAKKGAARLSKGGGQVSVKGEPARRARRRPFFVPSEELVALAAEVLGAKSGRKLSRKEAREAVLALGEFFGALREEAHSADGHACDDATHSVPFSPALSVSDTPSGAS